MLHEDTTNADSDYREKLLQRPDFPLPLYSPA